MNTASSTIVIRTSTEMRDRLDEAAKREGVTRSEFIRSQLEKRLEELAEEDVPPSLQEHV